MAAGFQFSATLHLDVPIVLQTLIQMVWPASLHLTPLLIIHALS